MADETFEQGFRRICREAAEEIHREAGPGVRSGVIKLQVWQDGRLHPDPVSLMAYLAACATFSRVWERTEKKLKALYEREGRRPPDA